jgi:predicted outer membrane repeat protein
MFRTAEHGGAIDNERNLALTGADTFTGNRAYQGGGIYNDDDLTTNKDDSSAGSLIAFNAATDEGGGVYNASCTYFDLSYAVVYGNVVNNIYTDDDC